MLSGPIFTVSLCYLEGISGHSFILTHFREVKFLFYVPLPPFQFRVLVLPVKVSTPAPPARPFLHRLFPRTDPSPCPLVTQFAASWMAAWDFMTWVPKSGISCEIWYLCNALSAALTRWRVWESVYFKNVFALRCLSRVMWKLSLTVSSSQMTLTCWPRPALMEQ